VSFAGNGAVTHMLGFNKLVSGTAKKLAKPRFINAEIIRGARTMEADNEVCLYATHEEATGEVAAYQFTFETCPGSVNLTRDQYKALRAYFRQVKP
jgi:iron only hydrogenase large subunit-like protein